jgi:hypothetical protein
MRVPAALAGLAELAERAEELTAQWMRVPAALAGRDVPEQVGDRGLGVAVRARDRRLAHGRAVAGLLLGD